MRPPAAGRASPGALQMWMLCPLTPHSSRAGFPWNPPRHHLFYRTNCTGTRNWAWAGPLPDGSIRAQPSLPSPWRGRSHPPCRQFSENWQVFTYLSDFNPSFEFHWNWPARFSLSVGGIRQADRVSKHNSLASFTNQIFEINFLECHTRISSDNTGH